MRAPIRAFLCGLLLVSGWSWKAHGQVPSPAPDLPVTNLLQLVQLLNSNERLVRDIQLEGTVCAASDRAFGVVILQDATDTELIEFGGGEPELLPGDKIKIDRKACLLRRREMGAQISVRPVVDNDRLHARSTTGRGFGLKKGRHSFTLEWFNRVEECSLEMKWQPPGFPLAEIPGTNVFHLVSGEASVKEISQPGLQAECFEGDWERVPDFDLLKPVRSGIVSNVDLSFRTRDQMVGLRFRGFFDASVSGEYLFTTRSADGSLLFIDDPAVPIIKIGQEVVPTPELARIDEPVTNLNRQRWLTVEGRVGSITPTPRGLELELYSHQNSMLVRIADANGLDASNLLNSQIRITGVGCGTYQLRGGILLGEAFVANAKGLDIVPESKTARRTASSFVKVKLVQGLPLEEARRGLPVHIQGVVTSKGNPYDFWLTVQDDTRGIFVNYHNASNSIPTCGDFYEIIGHSGAGDFAPVVKADQLVRLGKGAWPKAKRPTWDELNNGSMDVQWVEFEGLVTEVHSNTLSMLLPSGQMDVQVEGPLPGSLTSLERAVVRIRGVLFAVWSAAREVYAGRILMRNASITVDIPAPANPFDAVLKTPRELLMFDAQATAFRRVKVAGQIVYADAKQMYLQKDGEGLRLLPDEKTKLHPGDLVEAVGYPDISKTVVQLREVALRKTGEARLPPARKLTAAVSEEEGPDSTRVRIEGQLLDWHFEQGTLVLDMKSDAHLFAARLAHFDRYVLRPGSQLALEGVYVNQGRNQETGAGADSFELLLNSRKDILVLSQPSWWTFERLLILVGILVAILITGAIWITQLHRLVEQRTRQLQSETREREGAEHERSLEAERSRIARDLHDDLGASLTEISVLASKGQHSHTTEPGVMALLRAISGKARELVSALDSIVWAVDPKDNSLQSVADYLCDFADDYLSPSGIACRFDVPVRLPAIEFDGRRRHELFLAVKETLNNIVRHAEATEMEFRLAVVDDELIIVIVDNGKGFDADSPRNGYGLKNLPVRLSRIGGHYEIRSTTGKGTIVKIELQLSGQTDNANKHDN